MNFAIFARPVVTIYDLTETTKESDAGVVSTIGDEGLYGQVCQVRTAPGGVTAEGVTLPEEMAEVVSFYGYHGYVFASELQFCGEAELRSYLAAEWVMAGRATDVLTLPKVQGVRLLELERGALLRRLPEEAPHDGWALVRLVDGRTGYVRAVALEPVRWPRGAGPKSLCPVPLTAGTAAARKRSGMRWPSRPNGIWAQSIAGAASRAGASTAPAS